MRPQWNASVVLVPALLSSQMQWQALLRGMRSHGLSWLLAGVLLGERRYMGGAQIQCLRNVLVESNEGSLAMLRQSAATRAGDNDQQELLRLWVGTRHLATGSGQSSTKFSRDEMAHATSEGASFILVCISLDMLACSDRMCLFLSEACQRPLLVAFLALHLVCSSSA